LLTRSQRISHENLRLRDREWLEGVERWFWKRATNGRSNKTAPPMFAPLKLREMEVQNRITVSPMAMYSAVDGTPNDFHFVHYGERAIGGAGLLFTEMTCVRPRTIEGEDLPPARPFRRQGFDPARLGGQ
jgi:anthraniloyl-CoA monooxygenase